MREYLFFLTPLLRTHKYHDHMPPRVVLFVERNLDGTTGGSHYCLLDLVMGLDRRLFTPIVLFHQPNDVLERLREFCRVEILPVPKGISVPPLPRPFSLLGIIFQRAINFITITLPFFLRVIRLLRENRIEHIHLNNAPTANVWLLSAKLTRRLCSAHLRGFWQPRMLGRIAARQYDLIIAVSNSVALDLEASMTALAELRVIYDGIDPALKANKSPKSDGLKREDFGIDSTAYILGMVANITEWKGQHIAIQALLALIERFPNLCLMLIGGVSLSTEDQRYFAKLNDNVMQGGIKSKVKFLGYRSDVLDLLTMVDLVVHPPISPEPLGRVILESMLSRKLVIASNHGGPSEIIEDGLTGHLVTPGSHLALANKISDVIKAPSEQAQIINRAKQMVDERFNLSSQIRTIEHLFSRL